MMVLCAVKLAAFQTEENHCKNWTQITYTLHTYLNDNVITNFEALINLQFQYQFHLK